MEAPKNGNENAKPGSACQRSPGSELGRPSQSNTELSYAARGRKSSRCDDCQSLSPCPPNGAHGLRIGRIGRAHIMAFLPKSKALPLTFARANEVLTYCPATGHLRWHISRAKCAEGQRAGTLCKGYLRIQIDYVFYGAHRLAWLLSHGQWPTMGLDHINGIRD